MRDGMRAVVLGGMLLVLGASVAAAAPPPGRKCQSAKNQEAGKYASCLSKAEAKLLGAEGTCSVTTATECYADGDCPVSETCAKSQKDTDKYDATVDKCLSKFNGKWSSLTQKAVDAGDPCPDGLASGDIQGAVDEHVANVAAGLAGEGLSSCGDDCGNGGIDAAEDCDLGNLNGGTCAGEGFAGGVLRCGAGCVYDTSECYAARFVDNANGTITDNDTGLTWEKKVKLDSALDVANRQDADNYYRWSGQCSVTTSKRCQPDAASEAACLASVEGDPTGCSQCTGGEGTCTVTPNGTIWQWVVALNGASFGGHADWRVPTRLELESIVDLADTTPPTVNVAFQGASCGAACTDVTNPVCSCTTSANYWSASTYGVFPLNAWFIYFLDDDVDAITKTVDLYVRAVRGGS